ncbi:hypothetical protein N8850_03010 [Planktomarina temperata]|nr:hypothetical protein [Planktomarina temperata]
MYGRFFAYPFLPHNGSSQADQIALELSYDTMQFLKVSVDPSLALQQVTRSVSKAKLTSNQAMAMDAFYEATKGNVAAAGLALDEWRPFFNERHTGDNQASKNTAFARARKELVDKGLIKCSDDIYRLGDKAT